MACTDNFIGFRACGADESKSGLFIDQLGFTNFQAAHAANHSDITGIEFYNRIHDEAMMMLEDYFFERLAKFQRYKSYLGTEIMGKFSGTYEINDDKYTVSDTAYIDRRIGYIYLLPKEDAVISINDDEVELKEGEIFRYFVDGSTVEFSGKVEVAGCGGRGFQMEVIEECNPHRFFCKFLRYLKKPALYLVYARLVQAQLVTIRSNPTMVNMTDKNHRIYIDFMGGIDPVTGVYMKGKFFSALDNTIERIGRQLEETKCIECAAAKFVTQIP